MFPISRETAGPSGRVGKAPHAWHSSLRLRPAPGSQRRRRRSGEPGADGRGPACGWPRSRQPCRRARAEPWQHRDLGTSLAAGAGGGGDAAALPWRGPGPPAAAVFAAAGHRRPWEHTAAAAVCPRGSAQPLQHARHAHGGPRGQRGHAPGRPVRDLGRLRRRRHLLNCHGGEQPASAGGRGDLLHPRPQRGLWPQPRRHRRDPGRRRSGWAGRSC